MAAEEELPQEFAELLPPDSEFQVRQSAEEGRVMTACVPLAKGSDFLIEAPLVAWPLVPEMAERPPAQGLWCELCLSAMRRVRRRVTGKQPGGGEEGLYCEACSGRAVARGGFFSSELLWRWRRWQAEKSRESCVGIEAFARCFAHIASSAAEIRGALDVSPAEAVQMAARPLDRLAEPPAGGSVLLHGTEAKEVAEELRASEPFWTAIEAAVGCPETAAMLVSESSVDQIAGRLVLNAAGTQVLGAGCGGGSLKTAGLFTLLSTMNHCCTPTAEVSFSSSSTVTLRTISDVAVGEGLTLAYVPTDLPVEERKARLRHWFFECNCWRCEVEGRLASAL